jgi:phage tail sheath protein FI
MATEKYGISANLGTSLASTPVSTSTEVVFIGGAKCKNGDGETLEPHLNEPIMLKNVAEYNSIFGGEIGDGWSLSEAVESAFSICNLDHIFVINVFNPEEMNDESDITEAEIKGLPSTETGVYAINKIHPKFGVVPSILCCPLMTSTSLNDALKTACTKINGKFDAIVLADVPEADAQVVQGIAQPSVIVDGKPNQNERVILSWGHIKTSSGSVISGSAVKACLYAQNDANSNDLPYRSIGNVSVSGMQYVTLKLSDSPITLSDDNATALSADGITSFINIGGNRYFTWGDHTSAFSAGSVDDERARFDSNIRMLYYLTNKFQLKWRSIIDSPMTLTLRNSILNYEQNQLNYCVSQGALIGDPKIEFRPDDNTLNTLQQGQFYFTELATVTPPSKFIDLKLSFTSDGFKVYLEA